MDKLRHEKSLKTLCIAWTVPGTVCFNFLFVLPVTPLSLYAFIISDIMCESEKGNAINAHYICPIYHC